MASNTNRAQVLYGPRDLRLIERQIDAPASGEVQIAIRSTALCGSDLHYFNHYANGDIKIQEPLSQGHEAAGEVIAVGPDVKNLKIGDRVAVEAGVACNSCEYCGSGQYNVCPNLCFRGSAASMPHLQGTLQEKINHPEQWCHLLPKTVSYDEGALLEPLSVALHAACKCRITSDSRCLIIGAGAVGLLCAAVAKHRGCKLVVMTDIVSNRLAFAKESGFADEILINKSQNGSTVAENLANSRALADDLIKLGQTTSTAIRGYDHVFECTGIEACVRTSIYASRSSGDVLLVGMGTPIQILPMSVVGSKEISLIGVWRYAGTYPEALEIMAGMQTDKTFPDIRKLITHQFSGLDSVPDAFAMASRTQDNHGKLVIKVIVQNGY